MKIRSYFSNLVNWLNSTEMFARASKQIPGKWQLFEYYTEPDDDLMHYNEKQLKEKNRYWEIDFNENEQLLQNTNLQLPFQIKSGEYGWNTSGLDVIIIDPLESKELIRFRFAANNDELKLLRKDTSGKIQFFGFFKRQNT